MNTRLEGNDHTFTVGRPIAYLNDQCVLLQEESRGISLEQLLLQGCDTEAAVRRIARAVAAFNQESIAAPPLHLLEDQVAGLQRARSLLQWACPPLQDDLEAIVGGVAAGLKQAPVRPIHRDLKADHFLLDGSHLALLDLDSLVAADPVLDPATLLAQFFSMPFRFPLSRDRMREVAQTFAEEYFARVPPAWRRQLPLQYAAASMQVALGFFRRQEPRWAVAVVAIVEEARASLAGGVW
jgi:hypothetical protein